MCLLIQPRNISYEISPSYVFHSKENPSAIQENNLSNI